MKQYPTIDKFGEHIGLPIIAFDKLDGSNIRAEWSKKQGFYKFGTRNCIIDTNTDTFGKAVNLIKEKYEDQLSQIFTNKDNRNILSFICFFEFYGQNSCFGQHDPNEEQTVTLFDVSRYQKGFVEPRDFLKIYGHLDIPKVIYDGNLNHKLKEDIWNDESLREGIVCKGVVKTKKSEQVFMCKLKTKLWIEKLKERYGIDSLQFKDESKYII